MSRMPPTGMWSFPKPKRRRRRQADQREARRRPSKSSPIFHRSHANRKAHLRRSQRGRLSLVRRHSVRLRPLIPPLPDEGAGVPFSQRERELRERSRYETPTRITPHTLYLTAPEMTNERSYIEALDPDAFLPKAIRPKAKKEDEADEGAPAEVPAEKTPAKGSEMPEQRVLSDIQAAQRKNAERIQADLKRFRRGGSAPKVGRPEGSSPKRRRSPRGEADVYIGFPPDERPSMKGMT